MFRSQSPSQKEQTLSQSLAVVGEILEYREDYCQSLADLCL